MTAPLDVREGAPAETRRRGPASYPELWDQLLPALPGGAPARSAGGARQSLEQVGNGGVDGIFGDAARVPRQAALWGEAEPGRWDPADDAPGRGARKAPGGVVATGGDSDRALGDLATAPGEPCSGAVFGGKRYKAGSATACKARAWSVRQVNRQTGEIRLLPFRCRSWRCSRCAPQVNARDATRIETALGGLRLDELVFVTLTFDPKRWKSAESAWLHSKDCWKRLTDRLRYRYGCGKGRARENARIVYVQTWEQHANGWPHVHALVHCPALAQDVRRQGQFYSKAELRSVWRWQKTVLQKD